MPKDLTDIMVHFVISIVIACALVFLLKFVIGFYSVIVAYVLNFAFWALREANQYMERYPPHTWKSALTVSNWSRQKKLEGLAAPAAGGALGVLIAVVAMDM